MDMEKYCKRKSWKWWKPLYVDCNGKTQIKNAYAYPLMLLVIVMCTINDIQW